MASLSNHFIERTVAVSEVKRAIPADSRKRSTAKGLAYFAVTAAVYWLTFATVAVSSSWSARIGLALVNGLAVGMLFIVGHDACHGSLTPSARVNKWVGRLAFLPSLHPYSAWEHSHNAMHHGWTNLRGKDPVYCPLTPAEYAALSPWRRRLERLCRSWPGVLPLYLFGIWWPLEIMPAGEYRRQIDKRGTYRFDRGIVLAFPAVQAIVLVSIGSVAGVPWPVMPGIIAIGLTVPFLAFSWLMGFATFQHHTHPRVIWYADEAEWSFFRSQVQGTVHIVFPRWIEALLHNIMEHTAHHVDMKVPLYNLKEAQKAIEAEYGEENVISEPFSFAGLTRTFRTCQLYDYQAHQWLSFDGLPTTATRQLRSELADMALHFEACPAFPSPESSTTA